MMKSSFAFENETARVASYFSELNFDTIPVDIIQQAKLLLIDTLGCLAGGARTSAYTPTLTISKLFGGSTNGSLAGVLEPQGLLQSIYGNARLANVMDMDETFPVGVHFGAATVAAAVAAAEASQADGRTLLCGLVAGYELGARIATAVGPMMHVADDRVTGFAQVWGVAAPVVMAASAAYGRVRELSAHELQHAFGISGSNIPLPIGRKWSDAVDLPDVKYCDSGWCAVAGVHGVEAALAGTSGFSDILDGPVGIPEAYSAVMSSPEYIWSELGQYWYLSDLTYKPWPSCRFMHAAMSALKRILKANTFLPEQVEEIIIHTGPLANSARFRNMEPRSLSSYQFSYAHVVSMMLLDIPPGPDWFCHEISESDRALALRKKVRIELSEEAQDFAKSMTRNQIRKMPGGVSLRVNNQTHTLYCEYSNGDPWDCDFAYSEADVMEKFHSLVDDKRSRTIVDWIMNLERAENINPLTDFLRNMRTL